MRDDLRRRMMNSFRKYSRLGLASEKLDVFDAYERIRGCCRNKREAHELLAVYDTVRFLRLSGNVESLRALRSIYFSLSGRTVRKNEISQRIQRFAYENHCDERTVYRRLSYAVRVYRMMLGE